jgi:hypothetical protein
MNEFKIRGRRRGRTHTICLGCNVKTLCHQRTHKDVGTESGHYGLGGSHVAPGIPIKDPPI